MRRKYNNSKIKFYLGDVRDLASVESVVKGVDFIFHAAALKQVPSCEFFPMEAVKTNVLGTENVLYAAEKYEVSKVVVLSTDKAVYPINAMGMSKALMEKVTLARSRNLDDRKSIFCITRYGNVMASRGSVIPMFIEQIKSGKPITLTDAGMTRFMMTLEEAVELVEYAFDHGRQGDLFVRKAPGATIETLALALQELYKVRNEVRTIGTRHGEKMFETLVNREEMLKAEEMEDYYRIPANTRDLNYEQYFSEGYTFNNSLEEYHSKNTKRLDLEEMKSLLMQLPTIREDIFGEKNVIHDSE